MNIQKFTQKSMQAIERCEKLAYEYGNQEIEQEHLLYGLLTIEDSLILKLIEKMEIHKEHFLDRAEKLAEAHKKRVFLGFFGNKLHVAIQDGKDSLEPPSPFHKLDEAKEFQRVTTDLKLVTDIVDSLKLKA